MQKQSYVGLDVSLAETSICVIDETGARLFEGKVVKGGKRCLISVDSLDAS